MITIKTNISLVTTGLLKKLEILKNPNPLLRPVAIDVMVLFSDRIFEEGKAADGSSLGTYSNSYLRLREANGRGIDSKKKETFTRQLQKSYDVVGTSTGGWAIAVVVDQRLPTDNFLNKKNKSKGKAHTKVSKVTNRQIMAYQEEQVGKKIFKLSPTEKEYAINKLKNLIDKELNK